MTRVRGGDNAGTRLKHLVRVIEGEAPVAYAAGGGDASPNNSGAHMTKQTKRTKLLPDFVRIRKLGWRMP
jgi:hypothetical protein